MQEIIVYKDYGRFLRWQESDENGVFQDHVRLDTGSDEEPRLMIHSTTYRLDNVKIMDAITKQKFLEYERQIKELTDKRNELVEANLTTMAPVSWEWMKQHQDPSLSVPELYEHKNRIVALRRGSKVMVDGSTDAVRYGIAGMVGRLKRKGKKWATVDFEGKLNLRHREVRLAYVSYTMLLPYDYKRWLEEKKRIPHSQRLNIMSDKVTSALNKIL